MSTNYIDQITDSSNTTHYLKEGTDTRIFTGKCSTAGDQTIKVVELDDATNFSLSQGTTILVTFLYSNSVYDDYIYLQIDGTTDQIPIFVGNYDDVHTISGDIGDMWMPYESILFTFDVNYDAWLMNSSSDVVYYAQQKQESDYKVQQDYSSYVSSRPLLMSSVDGISSTSTRGTTTANVNNSIYGELGLGELTTNNLNVGTQINNLFKVTTMQVTFPAISAHNYWPTPSDGQDFDIPDDSKPSGVGWNLICIVGHATTNYRIYPIVKSIVDNNTIHASFLNTSASNVAANYYMTFYLLWVKCTAEIATYDD